MGWDVLILWESDAAGARKVLDGSWTSATPSKNAINTGSAKEQSHTYYVNYVPYFANIPQLARFGPLAPISICWTLWSERGVAPNVIFHPCA